MEFHITTLSSKKKKKTRHKIFTIKMDVLKEAEYVRNVMKFEKRVARNYLRKTQQHSTGLLP